MNSASAPVCLKVALPVPVPGLFDYLGGDRHLDRHWIGCRVRVPFGNRSLVGWVADIGPAETADGNLKAIADRLDPSPLLAGEALASLQWTARYYQAPLGEVIAAAVPALLREGKPMPDLSVPAWRLTDAGTTGWRELRRNSRVRQLAETLAQGQCPEAEMDVRVAQWRPAMR